MFVSFDETKIQLQPKFVKKWFDFLKYIQNDTNFIFLVHFLKNQNFLIVFW